MGRKDAHAWLAVAMGIDNVDECQIGLFDVADCNRVVILVGAWWAQHEGSVALQTADCQSWPHSALKLIPQNPSICG